MNSIELLESRIAPAATAVLTGGVLHIDHITGVDPDHLLVFQNPDDSFHVTDTTSAADYGTFAGVKNIDIKLSGTTDDVTVRLSATGLPHDLKIATGGGDDNLSISPSTSFGRIGGSVLLAGGAGKDGVNLVSVAIKGNLSFTGEGATDAISADNLIVSKTVIIDNVENTTFQPSSPVIFGALDIDQDEAASPVVFILNHVVTVQHKLTYCGSPTQSDTVTVLGTIGGPALMMLDAGVNTVKLAGRFNNTLTITGGGDSDTILFTDAQTALADPNLVPNQMDYQTKAVKLSLGDGANTVTLEKTTHFNDALTITTGAGTDTVNFADFFVEKNLTLTLGDGANTLSHINATTHGIGGSFKYTGGAGTDTLSIERIVADRLTIKLGDGANSLVGNALIVGNSVSITGGSGVDEIGVSSAFGIQSNDAILKVSLGLGTDTLVFTSGALAGAKLDGGGGVDTIKGTSLLPANSKIDFENKFATP